MTRYSALIVLSLLAPAVLDAQAPLSAQEIHDRITTIIRHRATRPLPSGDTAVVWYNGPTLYEITAYSPTGTSTSLLRNDSLIGTEEVQWDGPRPRSFEVTWTAGGTVDLHLAGALEDTMLVVTGTRSRKYHIPRIPWTVADFGMDALLGHLASKLPEGAPAVPVAIYRPYVDRWDTLLVSLTTGLEESKYLQTVDGPDTTTFVFNPGGALVQVARSKTGDELRPLEMTARYSDYCYFRVSTPGDGHTYPHSCH